MSDPTPSLTELAQAVAEKSGEAQAVAVSTEQTLEMLALMGVADPEAELRLALRLLTCRPGAGLRA